MSISIICVWSLIIGIWRGEDLSADPFGWMSDATFGVAWLALWLVIAWRKPASRTKFATFAVIGPCVLAIGLYIGTRSASRAYNECVQDGELVREALSAFYEEHQFYPEDLDSLGMEELPGGRVLRGNILWYQISESGYDLIFGDWLVSHSATESSAFMARK